MKNKYTTTEGHEVKIGECYETRDGRKVFISKTILNSEDDPVIYGQILNDFISQRWFSNGFLFKNNLCNDDIIRPWIDSDINRQCIEEIINISKLLDLPEGGELPYNSIKNLIEENKKLKNDKKEFIDNFYIKIRNLVLLIKDKQNPNNKITETDEFKYFILEFKKYHGLIPNFIEETHTHIKDMWKGWFRIQDHYGNTYISPGIRYYATKELAKKDCIKTKECIAITRTDQMCFYEGEGLND